MPAYLEVELGHGTVVAAAVAAETPASDHSVLHRQVTPSLEGHRAEELAREATKGIRQL